MILELKARFGELAIELIKLNNIRQKILTEQQEVLDKLAEAEKAQNINLPPESKDDDIVHTN